MPEIYLLRFYRVEFGDTAEKDVPLIGDDLAELKEQACEALTARFQDEAAARRKRSKVPHTAVILDKNEHVIARFQVDASRKAAEIPHHLWHPKMAGTPTPELAEYLQERFQ